MENLNMIACHYLAMSDDVSLLTEVDLCWDDWSWGTFAILYHIPMLFISLWEEEELTDMRERLRIFKQTWLH